MKTRDEIRRIKKEVEADLLKRPGVTGVDINYKFIGGKKTDVSAIVVYVAHKCKVPEGERIPTEIQDVPTDVVERSFSAFRR